MTSTPLSVLEVIHQNQCMRNASTQSYGNAKDIRWEEAPTAVNIQNKPIEDLVISDSCIADLSVFDSIQSAQNAAFISNGVLADVDYYDTANGKIPVSRETKALQDKANAAELELRKRAAEFLKVHKASLNPDPAKVTQYTGVAQSDDKWSSARLKYIADLNSKTKPKYYDAAKTAYEAAEKALTAYGASRNSDLQAGGGGRSMLIWTHDSTDRTIGAYHPSRVQQNWRSYKW